MRRRLGWLRRIFGRHDDAKQPALGTTIGTTNNAADQTTHESTFRSANSGTIWPSVDTTVRPAHRRAYRSTYDATILSAVESAHLSHWTALFQSYSALVSAFFSSHSSLLAAVCPASVPSLVHAHGISLPREEALPTVQKSTGLVPI